MGNITKFKTVKVEYTVPTVSASHVSRLLAKMESPRQVPYWGNHTIGSMAKYTDTDSWGWEVSKAHGSKDEYVWVTYYRHREMRSSRLEIEAIRKYLIDQGFEVDEPKYRYGKSWRRAEDGQYVDYEEETSAYLKVSKPVPRGLQHCETCSCAGH